MNFFKNRWIFFNIIKFQFLVFLIMKLFSFTIFLKFLEILVLSLLFHIFFQICNHFFNAAYTFFEIENFLFSNPWTFFKRWTFLDPYNFSKSSFCTNDFLKTGVYFFSRKPIVFPFTSATWCEANDEGGWAGRATRLRGRPSCRSVTALP